MQHHGAGPQRGLTLVEMTIVIAIIALVSAVAVTSVESISKAGLRSSSSKLAGFIRGTLDDASLGGQTHRLTFDFASAVVSEAATDQVLAFDPESNVLVEATKASAHVRQLTGIAGELLAKAKEQAVAAGGDAMSGVSTSALSAIFDINTLADEGGMAEDNRFTATDKKLDLGEDVHLFDVWVQGMHEPAKEGQIYLYFFANGTTQDAIINLVTDSGDQFGLRVSALTGKTRIQAGHLEAPKR